MRYQLSRKTLVPSNRKFHHGRSTIVGRLVVLSVFMLVLGVTSTPAQTGQDERCSEFTGQAQGLCTAAVAAGCFDGDESQACDALTTNWRERCRACVGPAPWEAVADICPCAEEVGSAVELNSTFEGLARGFTTETACLADPDSLGFERFVTEAGPQHFLSVVVRGGEEGNSCAYVLEDAEGSGSVEFFVVDLTQGAFEACQEDIRPLIDELDCPTP